METKADYSINNGIEQHFIYAGFPMKVRLYYNQKYGYYISENTARKFFYFQLSRTSITIEHCVLSLFSKIISKQKGLQFMSTIQKTTEC